MSWEWSMPFVLFVSFVSFVMIFVRDPFRAFVGFRVFVLLVLRRCRDPCRRRVKPRRLERHVRAGPRLSEARLDGGSLVGSALRREGLPGAEERPSVVGIASQVLP